MHVTNPICSLGPTCCSHMKVGSNLGRVKPKPSCIGPHIYQLHWLGPNFEVDNDVFMIFLVVS